MFLFGFEPHYRDPEDLAKALERVAQVPYRRFRENVLGSIGWQSLQGMTRMPIPEQSIEPLVAESHEMAGRVAHAASRLKSLEDAWDGAVNQSDADAIAAEPLHFGLKAMFALEGIDRALDQYPENPRVGAAATELAKAYDAYDEALLDHLGVLCTLADGDALKRLRDSLPETCTMVPWWLNGALEDAAKTLTEQTDALVEAYARRLGDS
jgi:hypothetical protein